MKALNIFYGENTYLIENEIKKIKKDFGELVLGINYVPLDENNVNTIISELETPPFGYEKKLIIAKNCSILKKETKTKKNKNSEISQKIAEYIKTNFDNIENNIVFIIIEETAEKTTELYKQVASKGEIKEFTELKPEELIQKLKAICNAYKVSIDNETLKYIVETCGTSLQELINEIRKLIEYAGAGGKIDRQAVDLLATPKIEVVIFDLTDNLGSKKIAEALEVLKNLIYNKEPIQKILITLYNHFKKLYLVKLAEKENSDIMQVLNLKPNQTFLISKYKKQAGYFEEMKLRKILQELIDLDANSKIGQIDLNIGLEAILCNCI